MRLLDVVQELMHAAAAAGVSTPDRWGERPVQVPMALVELPDRIDYDPGGTGVTRYPDVSLVIAGGDPTRPDAFRQVAAYADDGPDSLKTIIEEYPFTTCTAVRVAWAEPQVITLAGTDRIAMVLHVDISGPRG